LLLFNLCALLHGTSFRSVNSLLVFDTGVRPGLFYPQSLGSYLLGFYSFTRPRFPCVFFLSYEQTMFFVLRLGLCQLTSAPRIPRSAFSFRSQKSFPPLSSLLPTAGTHSRSHTFPCVPLPPHPFPPLICRTFILLASSGPSSLFFFFPYVTIGPREVSNRPQRLRVFFIPLLRTPFFLNRCPHRFILTPPGPPVVPSLPAERFRALTQSFVSYSSCLTFALLSPVPMYCLIGGWSQSLSPPVFPFQKNASLSFPNRIGSFRVL